MLQFETPSFREAVFSEDLSSSQGTIEDHAFPISSVERDPISGHDAMSIVRAMAEQDNQNLVLNQPRSVNNVQHESDNDNIVNPETMRVDHHTHVHGSGYSDQPSYHAAPYEKKEINRYADVYKYDWKEYEKNQRDLSKPQHSSLRSMPSLETSINSPDAMTITFEAPSSVEEDTISSSRRSSQDDVSLSSVQRPNQQVPPPTSPTDSSLNVMTTTMANKKSLPFSRGRQLIPRRSVMFEEVMTTTTAPETTTTSDFFNENTNDEVSLNTIPPTVHQRHPSIFNNVITFRRQQQSLPPPTTTLSPIFFRPDNEVTTTLSSILLNDEIMTLSPLKFVNHLSGNTMSNSDKAVRVTRNKEVEGDEVIIDTTTALPFVSAFRSSMTSSSQLTSSSLSASTNNHNKTPPKESIGDLIRLTSFPKKPIGLFRNKLVDKRIHEKLSRKQEALSLRADKKPIVIKFSG